MKQRHTPDFEVQNLKNFQFYPYMNITISISMYNNYRYQYINQETNINNTHPWKNFEKMKH